MGELGALLRTMRHEAGLTQEELAEKAQLTARSLRAIESGGVKRPRVRTLRSLAVALGLTDDAFRHLRTGIGPEPVSQEPPLVPRSQPLLLGRRHTELAGLISRIADDDRLVVLSTAGGQAVTALVIKLDELTDHLSDA
jgi:transcriptional regulator with XRE-family HTH domain